MKPLKLTIDLPDAPWLQAMCRTSIIGGQVIEIPSPATCLSILTESKKQLGTTACGQSSGLFSSR